MRLLGDRVDGNWLSDPISSRVEWRGKGKLDLALLRLKGAEERYPDRRIHLRFGRYNSVVNLEGVWFAGFPWAARGQETIAREYSAPGELRKADTGGIYRLTVASADAPKKDEDWRGLSGAVVILRKRDVVWLLGAVQQVPKAFGTGALEVAPIEAAFNDHEFTGLFADLAEIEPLERLPGAYQHVGAEAFAASREIFGAFGRSPFYGRTAELELLDDILAESDRGIILLRGEAGLGKSAFAARWAERCSSDADTTVLRHAFSVRKAKAGTRAAMVRSLVRQVVCSLGAEELGEGEPGDAEDLEDRLGAFLGRDQPEGMRVIIVLDALDEAAEPIEPWETNIGRGVYLLVTCRAEVDETPSVLRIWQRHYEKDSMLMPKKHSMSALDAAAIAAWLRGALHREIAATDPLVLRTLEASEGVPLFATFLIPEAIPQLQGRPVDPTVSEKFAHYVSEQLDDLRGRINGMPSARWSWLSVGNVFALLAVAKGRPLPITFIQEFSNGVTLDELDQRAERWLWRRPGEVSLAHPRLAEVFGSVLPIFEVNIRSVEDRLVSECDRAWRISGQNALESYALAWLPTHLKNRNRLDEAAKLLGNGAFHLARLISSPDESTVRRTSFETVDFASRYSGAEAQNLIEWRRFWSETEGPLKRALANGKRLGMEAKDIFAQIAGDRFGWESSVFRPIKDAILGSHRATTRIAQPCGFRHLTLQRSIDDAHKYSVFDVFALGRAAGEPGLGR